MAVYPGRFPGSSPGIPPRRPAQAQTAYPRVPGVPVSVLMDQVGRWTFIRPDGMVLFNEPLVAQIAMYRDQAVPVLERFLATVVPAPEMYLPQVLEGLYLADRLAQNGVQSVARIAPAVAPLNSHPHPLIQIYLAGFYRKINRPETFGPMLSTLIRESMNPNPAVSPMTDPTQEVGGALLQQIADKTSKETVRRLLPFLNLKDNPGN